MEQIFKGSVIDEDQHDVDIKKGIIGSSKTTEENPIPRSFCKTWKILWPAGQIQKGNQLQNTQFCDAIQGDQSRDPR